MTEPDGLADCGVVFTQNITAAHGAGVNAVQHGDQYNHIYRGTPLYRVELELLRCFAHPPGLNLLSLCSGFGLVVEARFGKVIYAGAVGAAGFDHVWSIEPS